KSFSGESIKDVEDVINSAISLCEAVNSKKYNDLASEYKKSFQVLLKEDKAERVTTESQDPAPSSSLPSSDSTPDNLGDTVIYQAFEEALRLVNEFCGILCDVLGISSGNTFEKQGRLISWEEVKERLPTAWKCLEDLTCSMR
ncbi:hypothetical protein J437_LFUL002505, partial [Ladona fulva]